MEGDITRSPSYPIAALTYLFGFVSGIVFLYVEPYNQDEFVRFHARQSIGFSIACIALDVVLSVFIRVLPGFLSSIVSVIGTVVAIGLAVYWVFLMYKAYTGERYRIPELSDIIEQVAGPNI